jgi:hypothetical protein
MFHWQFTSPDSFGGSIEDLPSLPCDDGAASFHPFNASEHTFFSKTATIYDPLY